MAQPIPHILFINMGRGKLGGTKAKIRGKVGAEIYQVVRTDEGSLEQHVYKAPESREYTNTEGQAKARMIMGQIERMFHILPDIIRYAFDTIPSGSLCFQHFSRLNYNLLREDLKSNWDGLPNFDWRPKYELSAPAGTWKLTDGSIEPFRWGRALFSQGMNNGLQLSWDAPNNNPTIGDFYKVCGMQDGDMLIALFYVHPIESGEPYILQLNLRLNPYYKINTPLEDTLPDFVFVHDTDWDVLCQYDVSTNEIDLEIVGDNVGFDYYAACGAFVIVRKTERGTLFSSAEFQWMLGTGEYGYPRNNASQAFETWQ